MSTTKKVVHIGSDYKSKRKAFSTSGYNRAFQATALVNSGETRADQDAAQYASIDFILRQFTRTGSLPIVDAEAYYGDISQMPNNITDMMSQLDRVYDIFSQLPSDIRLKMNNDVRNYPAFAQSETGKAMLMEAGFIPKPQEPAAPVAPVIPAPSEPPKKTKSSDDSTN